MKNNVIEEREENQPKPRLTELVLYLFVGFGLYFLATLIFFLITDGRFSEITIGLTAVIGIINAICLIGTVYFTGVRRGKISWAEIGFIPPKLEINWLLIALLISLILMPVRALVGAVVELVIHGNLESLQVRGEFFFAGIEPTILNFFISILIIGLVVPISEELFFRGLLYRWFRLRFMFWPAVFLSSILFGLAHYDSLAVIISSFLLGIANAIAMERTKSIWVPIVMHAITNGAAVILMYLVLFLEPYLGSLS